jgi:glycosyltransferase involved in cell wall biosynthesis
VTKREAGGQRPPRVIAYLQGTSEVGGSDIALLTLVSRLDRQKYEPLVILPGDGPLVPKLREAGARVLMLALPQLRSTRNVSYQARYLGRFAPAVARLARLLRREGADLLYSNSLYALHGAWSAKVLGLPHVWHIREIPDASPAVKWMLRTAVRILSTRVITMTDAVARAIGEGKHVYTIPDGIDLERFNPRVSGDRIRRELGIGDGDRLVGFVARLDPWKGADVFIRAAAEVSRARKDTRFLVCGGELPGYEAYAARLRQLARDLGIEERVLFTGWKYRLDDIPEVMAALDVLVHTSIRPEPFGLVMVEAMATERPVVAADDGGVREVVEAGVTALLAQPGDHEAVAAAVREILSDPTRAAAMGKAGRARAERLFEVGGYVRRIEAVYSELLTKP